MYAYHCGRKHTHVHSYDVYSRIHIHADVHIGTRAAHANAHTYIHILKIHTHTCEHANTHVHIDIHANTLTHTLNNPPRVRVPQTDLQVPITRTHCTLALHPNPKVESGTWSCHTQRTHLTKPCWLLHSCNSELFHIARRGTKGITPNSHICTV